MDDLTIENARFRLKAATQTVFDVEAPVIIHAGNDANQVPGENPVNKFVFSDCGFGMTISRISLNLDGSKKPYLVVTIWLVDRNKAKFHVVKNHPGKPFLAALEDVIQSIMPNTLLITKLGVQGKHGEFRFVYDDNGVIDYSGSVPILASGNP